MTWEIRHGDALALLRDLPDASVDAVITDPPYSSGGMVRGDRMAPQSAKYVGSGPDGKTSREFVEFTGDMRDQRAYGYWCALWMGEALRVAKPGAPLLLFTDWRQLPTTVDAMQAGGWVWRGIAVWDKTDCGGRPMMGRFRAQSEYVLITTMAAVGIIALADWAAAHRERGDCPECKRRST